jgi:hypothetical protein
VKNRFQNLPFRCNLRRYSAGLNERSAAIVHAEVQAAHVSKKIEVGLCTLKSS